MKEIWKDIEGYEGLYQVSNFGRVKSLERIVVVWNRFDYVNRKIKERILTPRINKHGYLSVHLYKETHCKTMDIHRLVAQAFILNSEGKSQVNHLDGNKQNNLASNLEWVTPTENTVHAYKAGLANARKGKWNILSKEIIQYDFKMKEIARYGSIREAERMTGCPQSLISRCCSGKQNKAHGYIWRYKEE